jgi:hypothetical protein
MKIGKGILYRLFVPERNFGIMPPSRGIAGKERKAFPALSAVCGFL